MKPRAYLALALVACTKASSTQPGAGSGSGSTMAVESHAGSGSAAIAPTKPPPPPPNDRKVRVPPDPPAVTSIAFVCSHSDEPFGNGSQLQMSVYDLDLAVWTKDSSNTPSTKDRGPPPPAKTEHAQGKITPAKIALLRAAVVKVLAGGPYEPEYPVPEGVSCHMTLAGAKGDPFFQIDKAKREQKDAVNELLNAL